MTSRGICNTCGQTFRLLTTSGKVPHHADPFRPLYGCKGGNDWPESIAAPSQDSEQ